MFEFFKKPKQEQVVDQQENREEITRDSLLKRVWNNKYAYLIPVVLALTHVPNSEVHAHAPDTTKKEVVVDAPDNHDFANENLYMNISDEIIDKLPSVEKILGSKKSMRVFLHAVSYGETAEKFLCNFDRETEERLMLLSKDFVFSPRHLSTQIHLIKSVIFDDRLDSFIEMVKLENNTQDNHHYPRLDIDWFMCSSEAEKDFLQNPSFINGIKIAKELDVYLMKPHDVLFLVDIANTHPEVLDQMKILKKDFNISFMSTFVFSNIIKVLEIDFKKQDKILKLLNGGIIFDVGVLNSIQDNEDVYQELTQDPVWDMSIKKLVNAGFAIDGILQHSSVLEKYKYQSFVDLLIQMRKLGYRFLIQDFLKPSYNLKTSMQGQSTHITSIFDEYHLDTKQGCDQFFTELEELIKINSSFPFSEGFIGRIKTESIVNNVYKDIDKTNKAQRVDDFLEDPALGYMVQLGYDKKIPDFLNTLPESERTEWILRTTRNMYAEGIPATEDNFKEYLTQTILLQSNPEFTDMDVFKGRNVICLGHNEAGEKWYQHQRYLNDTTQKSISAQSPKSMQLYQGGETKRGLDLVKSQFLETVSRTKDLTIYFNGHGDKDNIYLSDGFVVNNEVQSDRGTISINTEEFAQSLIQQSKLGDDSRVIIISHSCFSQNFVRALYEKLEEAGVEKLPIMIGMSEYGQYSSSVTGLLSVFNDKFFENMLKESSGATKIQDIIDLEQKNSEIYNMPFNISIFFPIKNQNNSKKGEIHWQIAEAEYLKNKTDENNPVT